MHKDHPDPMTRSSIVLSRYPLRKKIAKKDQVCLWKIRAFAIDSSGSPSCHHQLLRTVDRPASGGGPGLGTLFVPAISLLCTALRSCSRSLLTALGMKSLSSTCFRVQPFTRHRSTEKCHGWSYRKSSAELAAGVGAGGGGTEAVRGLGTDGSGLGCNG